MVKKILKVWFIIMGTSWMLYGASENTLHIAQEQQNKACGGDGLGFKWGHVWPTTIRNFKEAFRLTRRAL